jgi:para-nitrobenzyl esterase
LRTGATQGQGRYRRARIMAAPHQQRLLLRALPVCLQVVCLLLASFSTSALPAAGPKTLVQTKSGSLQGFVERGSRKWLGVPYAEPPVGDLRWRPPQPYKPWGAEPRDATEFKPDCAQFGPGWPSLGETGLNYTSEDCLTMNIFAPLAPVPGGAAVIVFFPAGGYTWGAANDGEMNAYGKSSAPGWQDVVFITPPARPAATAPKTSARLCAGSSPISRASVATQSA